MIALGVHVAGPNRATIEVDGAVVLTVTREQMRHVIDALMVAYEHMYEQAVGPCGECDVCRRAARDGAS